MLFFLCFLSSLSEVVHALLNQRGDKLGLVAALAPCPRGRHHGAGSGRLPPNLLLRRQRLRVLVPGAQLLRFGLGGGLAAAVGELSAADLGLGLAAGGAVCVYLRDDVVGVRVWAGRID